MEPNASLRPNRLLLAGAAALLLLELATGLTIYLLTYTIPTSGLVILHTLGGVAVLGFLSQLGLRHLRTYGERASAAMRRSGYVSVTASHLAALSGLALAWQALTSGVTSFGLDLLHFLSIAVLLGSYATHLRAAARHRRAGLATHAAPAEPVALAA